MRLKASKEAGLKEVFIVKADDLTEDEQKQFIIKDNVGFGEWDWEMLANEWQADLLEEWGLDVPIFETEPEYDDLVGDDKNNPATMKITFLDENQLQKAEIDIQELINRKYPGTYFSVSAGGI